MSKLSLWTVGVKTATVDGRVSSMNCHCGLQGVRKVTVDCRVSELTLWIMDCRVSSLEDCAVSELSRCV